MPVLKVCGSGRKETCALRLEKHEAERPLHNHLCGNMIAGFWRAPQRKSCLPTCGFKITCGYAGKIFEWEREQGKTTAPLRKPLWTRYRRGGMARMRVVLSMQANRRPRPS